MKGHVAPHRWNDLWAGRVGDAERTIMERHAEKCRACARTRERVTRASDSFQAIRTQSSPDLAWDAVRARVHWSVSTAKRQKIAPRRPLIWGVAAAAAAMLLGVATEHTTPQAPVAALPPHETHVAPPRAAAPLVGLVSRAAGDVMIDGVRPADLFAQKLGAGTVIATGDGRVDIQFGDKSAFAIGPKSTVELRAFDAHTIELAIDGTIDVEVAARTADQRFVVDAGDKVIEVRGTQFRVTHDDKMTNVACHHGMVTVGDAIGKVEVAAQRKVEVAAGHTVTSERVAVLSSQELAALGQAMPFALPLWDPTALAQSSAPLEVATAGRRHVRVDGIELGLAPLRVRVMPGRHTVEAADTNGRFRRAGWVDVAAAPHGARLEVPAESPPTSNLTERRRQLRAGIDRKQISTCLRAIDKAGLGVGAYIQIELAIDQNGALGFLNAVDTDLPSATASCVLDVIRSVQFPKGTAATWREKIDL